MSKEKEAVRAAVGAATPEKKKKKSSAGVRTLKIVLAAAVILVLFWFGFTTQLKEGQCGVILRFGAVRREMTESGLYLKLPWPFEKVVTYDNRLQYLESNRLETTTRDKRNVILQSYVVWDVADPVKYHNSVGVQGAVEAYIKDQVFSATNSTLGTYDLTALVSLETEQIKIDQIEEAIFTRVRDNCAANYQKIFYIFARLSSTYSSRCVSCAIVFSRRDFSRSSLVLGSSPFA